MIDKKTLELLNLTTQDIDEYIQNPAGKIKDLKTILKEKIGYLEKRQLSNTDPEPLLSDDQMSYYFKQSLIDLENNRLEGFEIHRLLETMKNKHKGKEHENHDLLEKFKNSLLTNNQQWKLVTDFMGELFEQVMHRMTAKDVTLLAEHFGTQKTRLKTFGRKSSIENQVH